MAQSSLHRVFKKTEKGLLAVKLRDHALSFKLRGLLIMVDGVKTVEQLAQVTTSGADLQAHLTELLELDLIQELPTSSPISATRQLTASSANDTVTTPASALPSLQSAIKQSTRKLADLLGPNSEALCLQLEKCKTVDQYNERILAFRKVISGMRSETLANDFVKNAIL